MNARYKEEAKIRKGPNLGQNSPVSSEAPEVGEIIQEHPGFKLLGKSIMRKTQPRQFDIQIADQEKQSEIVETQVMNSMQSLMSMEGIVNIENEEDLEKLLYKKPSPLYSQDLDISDDELSAR